MRGDLIETFKIISGFVNCGHNTCNLNVTSHHPLRDEPLENLCGGRGRGALGVKYKKKISCKGKLNEKKLCMQINRKKY